MTRFRDWVVLVSLIIVAAIYGGWHQRCVSHNRSEPLAGAVRAIFMPLRHSVHGSSRSTLDFLYGVTHSRQLVRQKRSLETDVKKAGLQKPLYEELRLENVRLRKALAFNQINRNNWIPAEVIDADLFQFTITIGCGSRQGVKIGSPVMGLDGLVGQVITVGASTCQAMLIIAPEFSVGGRVQRGDSRSIGICQGKGDRYLKFNRLTPGADINAGDLVVTSGLSEIYPKGLVIGRVYCVWNDSVYNEPKAFVTPSANVDRLEEVFVLK